jgi:formate dehydrogenase subunit beta
VITVENDIREKARELLASGLAEVVIGFGEGTLPLTARPLLVRDAAAADKLVWNRYCAAGLARYVLDYVRARRRRRDYDAAKAKKVAVAAKPCDARALVTYIQENQFAPEDLFVIGIRCAPMADRRRVFEAAGAYRLAAAAVDGEEVVATTTAGDELRLPLADYLDAACATCEDREPPLSDVVLGETSGAPAPGDAFARVREQEARTPAERWAWLEAELSRCIRCYACRQACPACYCEECFAEQRNPAWIGPATAPEDVVAFHLVRAFHTAGRCVECGECERACPMNIELRTLSAKLVKDVKEKYGYVAGSSVEEKPPLATYEPDDPNEGFM